MAVPLNNLLNETKTALKTENSNVDITLSALKDAITKTGETVKTLADVVNALSNVTIGSALPEGTNVVGAVVNKNTDGDEIFTESNPGVMQFSGSIPEYGWLSTDDEPTPDDPTKMALGIVIDVSTDTMSTKYWNGSLWKELI